MNSPSTARGRNAKIYITAHVRYRRPMSAQGTGAPIILRSRMKIDVPAPFRSRPMRVSIAPINSIDVREHSDVRPRRDECGRVDHFHRRAHV
jgi:hypothetical protein